MIFNLKLTKEEEIILNKALAYMPEAKSKRDVLRMWINGPLTKLVEQKIKEGKCKRLPTSREITIAFDGYKDPKTDPQWIKDELESNDPTIEADVSYYNRKIKKHLRNQRARRRRAEKSSQRC